MKKYIIAIAAILVTAGMVNAQTAKKAGTTSPTVKTHHSTAAKKVSSTSPTVTTNASDEKKPIAATTKKKHHKKAKSVPASSK